jgi:hypothetical protein
MKQEVGKAAPMATLAGTLEHAITCIAHDRKFNSPKAQGASSSLNGLAHVLRYLVWALQFEEILEVLGCSQ